MTLGISTSMLQFSVTLSANDHLLYQEKSDKTLSTQKSISNLFLNALKATNTNVESIINIIVDIGPGGTSSVRTGVSFANGLAYSLKIPIAGVSSAELIGIEAYEAYNVPVAILYKSIKENYYCGIYNGNELYFKYAQLGSIRDYIEQMYPKIVLAGNSEATKTLASSLQGDVTNSCLHKVNPFIMVSKYDLFLSKSAKYPVLPVPITETNFL